MTIAKNIQHIDEHIKEACLQAGRSKDTLTLIAVTKGQPLKALYEAYAANIRHFGENYVQEAKIKMAGFNLPCTWHFLGYIQANKTSVIAKTFDWVHSLDRLKIAQLLHDNRPKEAAPLQLCVQVNIDNENQKSGLAPQELAPFIEKLRPLDRLKIRGLMAIPKAHKNKNEQFKSFIQLSNLLDTVNKQLKLNLDTLSMGMTEDYTEAIKAHATFIRIGRGIFGERHS